MIESEIIQPPKFWKANGFKILLLGDSCIDEYHYGSCNRISPEAPIPVFELEEITQIEGMAANVKRNLESFGLDVTFVTNESHRIIKRRFIDKHSRQMLLREDEESLVNSADLSSLDVSFYDAIVISDYCKGLINHKTIYQLCNRFIGPIFVDTKYTDLSVFPNSIIKLNALELAKSFGQSTTSELIITLGKHGAKWNDILFEAPVVDVFDVTGAGDVFLAALTFFSLVEKNLYKSIPKAVRAASISVGHGGIYTLTKNDIERINNV